MTDDRGKSDALVAVASPYLGTVALGHHGFSAAHTPADIAETLARVEDAVKATQHG